MSDEPLLIDSEAAARLLGISERALWTWTKRKAIPSRKLGRCVRYVPDELRAWIGAGCPTTPNAATRLRLAGSGA